MTEAATAALTSSLGQAPGAMPGDVAPYVPAHNTMKRWECNMAKQAEHARLVSASRQDASDQRALRAKDGVEGKNEYHAWNAERRAEITDALDGSEVTVTLSVVAVSSRSVRRQATGIATVNTAHGSEVIAIRGELSSLAVAADVGALGATATATAAATAAVRLVARRGLTKSGARRTGFDVRGMSLQGVLHASRYIRSLASAL